MIKREFVSLSYVPKPLKTVSNEAELAALLKKHGANGDILLAHATDGLIWGEVRGGILVTSYDVAPNISPALSMNTLQELRLFNEEREIRLWKTGRDSWNVRLIQDMPTEDKMAFDEEHLLWGTRAFAEEQAFFRFEDGEQGLRHVIPAIKGIKDGEDFLDKRLCLIVRHYLEENDIGLNRIAVSRLVKLGVSRNA